MRLIFETRPMHGHKLVAVVLVTDSFGDDAYQLQVISLQNAHYYSFM